MRSSAGHIIWMGAILIALMAALVVGATSVAAQAPPPPISSPTRTSVPPPGPSITATPTIPAVRSPTPTAAVPTPPVHPLLQALASRHQARLGVYVRHFGTGEVLQLNAAERFRAASLYKLFVLYSAFSRMAGGGLRGDEMLTMTQTALNNEPYAEWPLGTQTTVSCALDAMITISSNAAAAMLLERLGGEPRITTEAQARGFTATEITRERAFTSPLDVGRLLEEIASDRAVNAVASAAMRRLLLAQQRNDRLPYLLPLNVAVAHKTGELNKVRHDAGIIDAPSGRYVVVAMVEDAASDLAARVAIVDISGELYTYFERGGLPLYLGLPPHLAREILQPPDARGRLTPLEDPWATTKLIREAGAFVAPGAEEITLREEVLPDLLALQQAAVAAGEVFWVTDGYYGPRAIDAPFVDPSATMPSCPVLIPSRTPTPTSAPTSTPTPTGDAPAAPAKPTPPPAASQHWLGTVIAVADRPGPSPADEDNDPNTLEDGEDASVGRDGDDASTAEPRDDRQRIPSWLLAHAWEYGFVPALPESALGTRLGYEPWRLRWVGKELASQLPDPVTSSDYARVATAALQRAQVDLSSR